MTESFRRTVLGLWIGAALASLFFFPLLQVLNGDVYYLHWRPRHTAEFAVAFATIAGLFALAWIAIERLGSDRLRLVLLLLLIAMPIASFAVTVLRLLPLKDAVIPVMDRRANMPWLIGAAALVGLSLVAVAPRPSLWLTRAGMLLLSPVTLLVGSTMFTHAAAAEQSMPAPPAVTARAASGPSVFVFLFDELSFRFVYKDGSIKAALPNLRAFAGGATSYLAASAPGTETITSVPGLLAGRRMLDVDAGGDELHEILPDGRRVPVDFRKPDGLFARARASGLRAEAIGYFFPYCRLLSGVADQCRSFSLYNYATVGEGFSPVNQVLTNLILLPYQFPFGIAKVPAFALLQRRMVDQTVEAAERDLSSAAPRFRFVHFSVPHLPFIFDRRGYRPPADPMRQDARNYEANLEYVDTIVGRLVASLKRAGAFDNAIVVITSDHEYRGADLNPSEASHVPLIVKRAGQRTSEVVVEPLQAERILAGLFEPAK